MLVILKEEDGFQLDIRYATSNNLLSRPIYIRPIALLMPEARNQLLDAAARAKALGLAFKIYDAFRPLEVQWIFWEVSCPIPDDHIDPRRTAFFVARSILGEFRDGRRGC